MIPDRLIYAVHSSVFPAVHPHSAGIFYNPHLGCQTYFFLFYIIRFACRSSAGAFSLHCHIRPFGFPIDRYGFHYLFSPGLTVRLWILLNDAVLWIRVLFAANYLYFLLPVKFLNAFHLIRPVVLYIPISIAPILFHEWMIP